VYNQPLPLLRRTIVEYSLQFEKRAQLVVGAHDMAFSVAAMCVNEVEVLTVAHKTYITPCPPCFTQLVCDDLPILHARLLKQGRCRGFVRRELRAKSGRFNARIFCEFAVSGRVNATG
jgi:hypothetical protein